MSERSERVVDRATRHRRPLWRPASARSEPQPPLRRTRRPRRSSSGDSRGTKRSGWSRRAQGGSPAVWSGRRRTQRRGFRRRVLVGDVTDRRIGRGRVRLGADRPYSAAGPSWAAGPRGVPVGRSRRRCRKGRVSGASSGGQGAPLLRRCAQLRPLSGRGTASAARYCCAAPALARRQQSLRSWWTSTSLRSARGSLTFFITGADVGDHRRRSGASSSTTVDSVNRPSRRPRESAIPPVLDGSTAFRPRRSYTSASTSTTVAETAAVPSTAARTRPRSTWLFSGPLRANPTTVPGTSATARPSSWRPTSPA